MNSGQQCLQTGTFGCMAAHLAGFKQRCPGPNCSIAGHWKRAIRTSLRGYPMAAYFKPSSGRGAGSSCPVGCGGATSAAPSCMSPASQEPSKVGEHQMLWLPTSCPASEPVLTVNAIGGDCDSRSARPQMSQQGCSWKTTNMLLTMMTL